MDPIADLIIRIKNAQKVGHKTVEIPFSKVKFMIAEILKKEKFVENVERKGVKVKERIEVTLKYDGGVPAIQELRRISKSGQRSYIKARAIRPIKQGYGLAIISTPAGLMTSVEARKKHLGGEIICEVW